MSTFADSFWGGSDYAAGISTLFDKLQQGIQENQQALTIARLRVEAEDTYAASLAAIGPTTNRIDGGFQRDDGASTKKAYDGIRTEMSEASKSHAKIASNIRELVVNPFGRWSEQHKTRVHSSQNDLSSRLKAHDKQADHVRSCRSQYFNKCRRVEDLDEEDKLAFQDPKKEEASSPKPGDEKLPIPTVKLSGPDIDDEEEPIDIGDETYSPEQFKKILSHALENIKIGETKVPILGIYHNVSTGADITVYIQKHLNGTSMSYAERIGQDLIDAGYLRLVGNVGSAFANSSRMYYQWRPQVFRLTGLQPKGGSGGARTSGSPSDLSIIDNPAVGAVTDMIAGWNPLTNNHSNEHPADKLRREVKESDERYKASVRRLDAIRCNLEEAMVDHFKFMQRCELDRLRAIRSVILDFSGAISNVIPSLQSTVDHMMLFQETLQPESDLRYLLENYRTGYYLPRVPVYENYYNQVDDQIFGIEIEARARADRKRVPLLVTVLLTYLDHRYPDLEGDEARRGIWLVDVPLSATHQLRAAIDNSKSIPFELLETYDVPVVASVLKMYLLELPDSIVSSHVYEVIKTIYSTTAQGTSEAMRVNVLQSTLGQLRLANIATLDALMTHFARLIELTSADESYIAALASNIALCVLRPKQETSLTMTEKFNVRLVRDLFAHKDEIFGELKRASSSSNASNRNRAISTDESQRRLHMEERHRAIAAKTRALSPVRTGMTSGAASGHRRDRSTSAETRFPIATNSPVDRKSKNGLDIPKATSTAHVASQAQNHSASSSSRANGNGSVVSPSDSESSSQVGKMQSPVGSSSTTQIDGSGGDADIIPYIGASLSGPADFTDPEPFYAAATPTVPQQSPSAPDAQPQSASSVVSVRSDDTGPEKRNSLTRSRGVLRKTGSLPRHSLTSQRDSIGSVASVTTNNAVADNPTDGSSDASRKAIELTDKPMDD